MNAIGHNENAIRLAALAGDAQIALDKVARGEADAAEGWLAYGSALNEGRALFAGDREFGVWLSSTLEKSFDVHPAEQSAAMWAAANADQLAEAKANSKARTLRGWHDQWKKIEQEREAARQKAERDAEKKRLDEEAATARREAEEKAKAEKEAQKAIAAANTDEDREIAEAKAEKVAVEKAEADRIAVEAEVAAAKIEGNAPEVDAETAVDQPEDDKIDRKLRLIFRKLTAQAQEDDWVGLKRSLHEEKGKSRKQKAEIDLLKQRLKEISQAGQSKTIADLQAKCFRLRDAGEGHQAAAARLQRQVNAQKAEITDLKRQLENKVYVL